MKPWRIETILLDEDEQVAGITAVIDAPYLLRLEKLIYPDVNRSLSVIRRERGDTELWVRLDVTEMMTLFREVGNLTGLPEDQMRNVPGCFNSLSMVVYRLMDD